MTRHAPRVSVIVPTLNAERFLGDAIDSIYRSAEYADLDRIDVIVVDGGSTDATLDVAIARGPVRTVKQQGKGLADARNCGIHEAHGAIVAFLDADDRWTEDALRVRLAALAAEGSRSVVTGKVRFVDRDGAARDRAHARSGMVSGQTPGAVLLERSVVEAIGPFDTTLRIGADADWLARLRQALGAPYEVQAVVLEKGLRAGSLSTEVEAYRQEMLTVARRYLARERVRAQP